MYYLITGVIGLLAGLMAYKQFFVTDPPAPAPKRFGLQAATAAKKFLSDKAQANAVLAVVVGVLGYQNTVAEEAENTVNRIANEVAGHENAIDIIEDKIKGLKREIDDHKLDITDAERRRTDTKAVADLFGDAKK